MSSSSDQPQTSIRPEVRELAARMRAGLERRREWSAVSHAAETWRPVSPEDLQALRAQTDLRNLPPLAKEGRFAPVVRFLRRILGVLLRPWLAVQSDFNRQVVDVLESLHREIALLRTRDDTPAEKP